MRLFCGMCHKSVSNELPDDTIIRGMIICPECMMRASASTFERFLMEINRAIRSSRQSPDKNT